jgi:hypothetical protein
MRGHNQTCLGEEGCGLVYRKHVIDNPGKMGIRRLEIVKHIAFVQELTRPMPADQNAVRGLVVNLGIHNRTQSVNLLLGGISALDKRCGQFRDKGGCFGGDNRRSDSKPLEGRACECSEWTGDRGRRTKTVKKHGVWKNFCEKVKILRRPSVVHSDALRCRSNHQRTLADKGLIRKPQGMRGIQALRNPEVFQVRLRLCRPHTNGGWGSQRRVGAFDRNRRLRSDIQMGIETCKDVCVVVHPWRYST